jgi:hypothetical protein
VGKKLSKIPPLFAKHFALEIKLAEARRTLAQRVEPFTIPETAKLLGVDQSTLYWWRKHGFIAFAPDPHYYGAPPCIAPADVRRLIGMALERHPEREPVGADAPYPR